MYDDMYMYMHKDVCFVQSGNLYNLQIAQYIHA